MPCVVTAWVRLLSIPRIRVFQNPDCSFLWGVPDYLILQVPVFKDPWVSGRVWHRKPFSLWIQFCYLVLLFLGLFPHTSVEDGFHLFPDLFREFSIVDSPTVLVVYLFPILVVSKISMHIFLYFWVYWSAVLVREQWESQFREREPKPWRFLSH